MTAVTERLSSALADRYRIERRLGEGGMATVYLAEDLKHKRNVALKVLRPELAAVLGADRFVQEITTTASLQHPHILPLFDSGTADGFLFYVMPYVEGETLRDKLNREAQLSVEEAVQIATEVAAALDYAHRHGVIHRDIKPENILLHDGRPMVADFGIALAVSAAAGGRMTETGLSLGTPHYMSPEQATAEKDITARADVYSLACVLYEMLTGSPPHVGSTAQQIIMKIVTDDARPVTELRKSVPPHVAAALAKALEKLPADRFPSAATFAEALLRPGMMDTREHRTTAREESSVEGAPSRRVVERVAFGVAFLVLAAVALRGWFRAPPASMVERFDIAVAGGAGPATSGNGASLALAPDGSSFVYAGSDGRLYVREMGQLENRALPAQGFMPFYSPDGNWVGFAERSSLKKVAPAGGPPLEIVQGTEFRGATWGTDGTIVFTPSTSSPLLRVAEGGGPVDTLTRLDTQRGITSHRWPQYLPDQRGVVFQACRGGPDTCELAVLDLATDSVRSLGLPGLSVRYVSTGHLVYVSSSGALLAVPFDLKRLELTGNPVSLMEGILIRASWNGDFTIAKNGTLLYVTGEGASVNLSLVDSTGSISVLAPEVAEGGAPRLSPDGRRIALRGSSEGTSEIWIYDRSLTNLSRLTFEGNSDYPVWSPDGDTVYYSTDAGGQDRDIWRRAADGSGGPERVLERPTPQWEIAVAPAGDVALVREVTTTGPDLVVLPMNPPGDPTPWVVTEFAERSASLAPDGRWAAYTSNESGQDEVYVRAFPNAIGRWQISTGGGGEPLWSQDGRTIYYRHADSLLAVGVQTQPVFTVGRRRLMFVGNIQPNPAHTNYDRDPRTGEFVMMTPTQVTATSLVVVLNWFEELRERTGENSRDGRRR
ncbi:MAG TPA: protein kinase [Gemmatimonadales bacterium]|jgi:serine/threonine-protein kinase